MKPPRFRYRPVANAAEAIAFLGEHAEGSKVLAGGQSLMPMLNMRLVRPQYIVDLNAATELDYIRVEGDRVCIGALTRHRAVEDSPLVAEHAPLVALAMPFVGHTAIRYRGTIGGSLAHADPSAELPNALLALEAQVVVRGPKGERVVDLAELYLTYFTSTLALDELIVEVRIPKQPAGAGASVRQIVRRHGDFALVGVMASAHPDGGTVRGLRVTAMGVAGVPLRLDAVEELLEGQELGEGLLAEAALRAERMVDPEGDMHATADYRRRMTGVLTKRAVAEAVARAAR
jgi:CO/xanthine dehydrogenase FAD-binding subunit